MQEKSKVISIRLQGSVYERICRLAKALNVPEEEIIVKVLEAGFFQDTQAQSQLESVLRRLSSDVSEPPAS
jgi:predicted DNA-binding protein